MREKTQLCDRMDASHWSPSKRDCPRPTPTRAHSTFLEGTVQDPGQAEVAPVLRLELTPIARGPGRRPCEPASQENQYFAPVSKETWVSRFWVSII